MGATEINRLIPTDIYDGLLAANAPGTGNPIATIADISKPSVQVSVEQLNSVIGTSEQIIAEFNMDLTGLSANILVTLSGLINVGSASTGTFNVRVGGTIGVVDGTIRATVTTTSTSTVQGSNTGASFANPSGQQLIKITAVNNTAAVASNIRGIHLKIS